MDELKDLITRLHREKYPDANVIFLAGSVVRGEGTHTSDLDIVVLYESLPNAYRDSFIYAKWPVEAFVHDPETFNYFIQKVDAPTGVPSLAAMVSEGVELPSATSLSQQIKDIASDFLREGPAQWSTKEIDSSRYLISDLIEDLREPRSQSEMYAIAIQLYNAISNHFFRSKGLWSAKGKTSDLIVLADDLLSANGGFLFEGHRLDAPQEWKIG